MKLGMILLQYLTLIVMKIFKVFKMVRALLI